MQAWGGESGSSGDLRGGDQRDPRWVSGGRRAAASGCECYSGVGPAAPGPDESHVWPLAGGGDGGGVRSSEQMCTSSGVVSTFLTQTLGQRR